MAFFGAYPSTPPEPKPPTDRSQDLENLLGNYFITDHQLTRLRARIVDHIKTNQNRSTFMIRSDDEKRWYKIDVSIVDVTPEDDYEEAEPESKMLPNEAAGMIDDDDIVN